MSVALAIHPEPTPSFVSIPEQCREDQALVLPEGLSFDAVGGIYGALDKTKEAINWWLGDLVLYGERSYGEAVYQLFPERSTSSIRQCAWVAQCIPPAQRVPGVSWSHHRVVAHIEDGDRRRQWLEEAQRCEWSKTDLARAVAKADGRERFRLDPHAILEFSQHRLGEVWTQEDHERLQALLGKRK